MHSDVLPTTTSLQIVRVDQGGVNERILARDDAWWCDDPRTPEQESCEGQSQRAWDAALQELSELKKEQGDERTQALADMVGASGVPDTTPLTADQVRALRQKMKALQPTVEEMRDMALGTASVHLFGSLALTLLGLKTVAAFWAR